MKKRLLLPLLAFALVVSLLPLRAFADEQTTEASGSEAETTEQTRDEMRCGDDIVWSYENGTLTFTGTGDMYDMYEDVPWDVYRAEVEYIIFTGEITYIGAHAFTDYDALLAVDFGDSLKEIGYEAFAYCDGLTVIELPKSFKVFGEEAFMSCKNLTEIRCNGGFPSFRQNCLWDTYAKIIFPADRPWNVEYIKQLEEAFHGRIEFLASDGTDPYVPEDETEPTEAPTQAPTEATTEPPTEETVQTEQTEQTEPVTEQTEPIETTAEPTQEQTQPETELPTEADQEQTGSGSWVLLLIAALVLVIAVLILSSLGGTKARRRKRGKYTPRR